LEHSGGRNGRDGRGRKGQVRPNYVLPALPALLYSVGLRKKSPVRGGIPACSSESGWKGVTWRLELLLGLQVAPPVRAWAALFLASLHNSRSRALLSAFKSGLTKDSGLDDARKSLALLQAASQQAAAALCKPCEYWARVQAALILLNMKMYGPARAGLAHLGNLTGDDADWNGISFHILGREEMVGGEYFRKSMLNEWATLQMGLGEAHSAMPFYRKYSSMNKVPACGMVPF